MLLYFGGGMLLKRIRFGSSSNGALLPHHQFWASLAGLVVDGVALVSLGGAADNAKIATASASSSNEKKEATLGAQLIASESSADSDKPMQATRGKPTRLHVAAVRGDADELRCAMTSFRSVWEQLY